MIACPKCNSSNDDEALVCRNCSTLLDGPRPLAPRTGRVHRVDPPAAVGVAAEAAESEPQVESDGGHLGDAFDLPADDGDDADGGDEPDDLGTRRVETRPPEPPPLESSRRKVGPRESDPLDAGHQSAISHYRRGRPVISVIGFPSSGKTFLVNRLRKQLPDRGDWSSNRRYERRIPLSPEGLSDTVFTAHRGGGAENGDEGLSYAVIDCAGESFDVAFSRQSQESEIAGRSARSYLAALALASAYVFVVAAPEAIDERRGETALEEALYGFRNILSGILVAKNRLRGEEPEELLARGISRQELDGALDLKLRLGEPLVVAFAQADRLQAVDPPPTGYDHDPYLFARRHAPALFHAVRTHFRHHRFAFVSAFAGYRVDQPGVPEPDYALPSYGTAAVFDWLDRHLQPRPSLLGRFADLAAGAPSAHAERLRRLVDRRFGRRDPTP